jgi:hypothetical protein
MIKLFKLITGEFVVGKQNEEKKQIDQPYLIISTVKGIAMIEFFQGMAKHINPVPYSCVIQDVEPTQSVIDSYKQMISPIKLPKKKNLVTLN